MGLATEWIENCVTDRQDSERVGGRWRGRRGSTCRRRRQSTSRRPRAAGRRADLLAVQYSSRYALTLFFPPAAGRHDPFWKLMRQQYTEMAHDLHRSAKERADEAASALKEADKALKDRAKASGARKLSGHGLQVIRAERKGSVQYDKVPELDGVDLDRYRKKSSVVYSIR